MTRKRFVKLLMAHGCSRNLANDLAQNVVERMVSYQSVYQQHADFYSRLYSLDMSNIVERVTEAMQSVWDQCEKAARALSAGFAAFGKAYREALEE